MWQTSFKLFLNSQGLLTYIRSKVQAPGCCQLAWLYQMASMETYRFTAGVVLNRNAVAVTNKTVEAGLWDWRTSLVLLPATITCLASCGPVVKHIMSCLNIFSTFQLLSHIWYRTWSSGSSSSLYYDVILQ